MNSHSSNKLVKIVQKLLIFVLLLSVVGFYSIQVAQSQAVADSIPEIIEGGSIDVAMSEDASPMPFSLTLSAIDADLEDTLLWSILTPATNGTAEASGIGISIVVNYLPNSNFNGMDSFSVQVTDGVNTDSIVVNVTIASINDAPVAVDDLFFTPVNTAVSITAQDILANDTDVEGDSLFIYSITNFTNGTPGNWEFIPDPDFTGEAGFDYEISDNYLLDSGHVTVMVGDADETPPVLTITGATADEIEMDGDLETGFILETQNDSAVDHLIQFAAGTSADELLEADHFGLYLTSSTVSETDLKAYYAARDVPDPYLTYLYGAAEGANPFVFINGSTVKLADGAKYSIEDIDVDMTVPDDFPLGEYTVEGNITDLAGNETSVKLILIVTNPNDPPAFVETDPLAVTMSEDGDPTPFELTLHVVDPDPSETLTWSILVAAMHGTATATGTGTSKVINYVPEANYSGSDSFTVQVTDGEFSDTIVVNVSIESVKDPPAFVETDPLAVTMSEDGDPTPFELTLHVVDPDPSETLTWSILVAAAHGTATAIGTGTSKVINYVPEANYSGSDSFTVQVTDGEFSDTIVVNVSIESVNDEPIADPQSVITHEGESIGIHLTGSDGEGDLITVIVHSLPSHGTLSGNSYDLLYTPANNYTGEDSFTFKVFDGLSNSQPATVSILVKDPTPWMEEKLTTSKVTFNWKDTPGAGKYRIELSTKVDFSILVFSVKTVESKYLYETALKPSKTYYWRVKAKTGLVWDDDWTTYKFYSMDPLVPPLQIAPAHKGWITDTRTPRLEWQKVNNAVSYRVVISTSSDFSTVLLRQTVDDPHYLVPTLPNGKYYWKVRALDASGGKGPWSETWIFKILVP